MLHLLQRLHVKNAEMQKHLSATLWMRMKEPELVKINWEPLTTTPLVASCVALDG